MKKKIALVTGGYTGESVISYQSAETINKHLDKDLYDVYTIDIQKEGWWFTLADGQKIEVDKNDFSLTTEGRKIVFDLVFIGMHGSPGEDGRLQGYFDLLKIPYTGCDAATSALTMNKRFTVAVAGMGGIAVARSVLLFKKQYKGVNEQLLQLQFPVFIKPNSGGSSIGMSKINRPEDGLEEAIQKAFREDEQVLVEEMITGREFTVGVYRANGEIKVLPFTEIKADVNKPFFDFESKYHSKGLEITPADVDEKILKNVSEAAQKVYRIFNCGGVIRIDFIYHSREEKPYMLEINTVPGQTAASIIPQQVEAIGGSLKDFYTILVEEALQKDTRKIENI